MRHAINGACVAPIERVTERALRKIRAYRDRTPRARRSRRRSRGTWFQWVDGYLRSDGVRVVGYYRACLERPRDDE
jgi:hypothetical protein